MIQRLQTIFLLLTSVFYFSYWLFGLEWYEKGYPVIINVFNGSEYVNTILISISFIPLIISWWLSNFMVWIFMTIGTAAFCHWMIQKGAKIVNPKGGIQCENYVYPAILYPCF